MWLPCVGTNSWKCSFTVIHVWYQGLYRITKGLLQTYGPENVVDTPITEMIVPMIKAAIYILLAVVLLYNTVSSLSQREQTMKLKSQVRDMSVAESTVTQRTSDGIYMAINIYQDKHRSLTMSEKSFARLWTMWCSRLHHAA